MIHLHRHILLVGLLVAVAAGMASGQPGANAKLEPNRPAMREPGQEDVADFRQWLHGNLKQSKPMDPKMLKELMDKLNKMPKDQQPDKAQIEKMLKENPKFKDKEFLKQLEKMLQDPDFANKLPKDVPIPKQEQDQDHSKKLLNDVIETGKAENGDPALPKDLPDPSKLPMDDGKNPYEDNEWVKWAEKNFGDSPAAKDAIKDLVTSMQKGDLKGIFDDVPEFKDGAWKDFADWGKSNGADFGNIKPPDLSTGKSSPNFGGGGGGGSSLGGGGAGSVGAGGLSLGGGGGTALLVIAGIAAAIFIGLMLFRRWKVELARREALGLGGLGGIDLDAVRTREELVKAFDHVSLDQIGEEARPWNHRVIADQIAETRPAQAAPAEELAGLYERARYAPTDEDLTAGEFADARRDLRVIAGGPA